MKPKFTQILDYVDLLSSNKAEDVKDNIVSRCQVPAISSPYVSHSAHYSSSICSEETIINFVHFSPATQIHLFLRNNLPQKCSTHGLMLMRFRCDRSQPGYDSTPVQYFVNVVVVIISIIIITVIIIIIIIIIIMGQLKRMDARTYIHERWASRTWPANMFKLYICTH